MEEKRDIVDVIWKFDKLRDVMPEKKFNFFCSECKSENIDLRPYNICWRTTEQNKDLPSYMQKALNHSPNKIDAILLGAQQHTISFICLTCGYTDFILDFIDRLKLMKWIQKRYKKVETHDE